MQNSAMQKNVSKGLPYPERVHHRVRYKAKPIQPEISAGGFEDQFRNLLQEENQNADNANRFNSARKIPADIKPVAARAARKGSHSPQV